MVEGKATAATPTSAAGKMKLMVENVQDAVVKTLATQGPDEAAFAGMHEFERGNRFGLEGRTALGAIAESATADEASSEDVVSGKNIDTRPGTGPDLAEQVLNCFERISVAVRVLSICVAIVAQWGASIGELENEAAATLRNVAGAAFTYAATCGVVEKAILFIFVVGLQPAAAYVQQRRLGIVLMLQRFDQLCTLGRAQNWIQQHRLQ